MAEITTTDIQALIASAPLRAHGFDLAVYDEAFLTRSLAKRMEATGHANLADYAAFLCADAAEAVALFRSLRISYSEFFRNHLGFAVLEEVVLPRLLSGGNRRDEIRVWCAGCGAGQEAYSVAMLLDELISVRGSTASYRIFATDISEAALALARLGIYDASSMGNVRTKHLHAYFSQNGETFTVAKSLKERIEFSLYDLLDERTSSPPVSIFGDFDLVICSNLLFYYRTEMQERILGKVLRSLSTDGCLLTGEAERGIIAQTGGFVAPMPPAPVFQRAY